MNDQESVRLISFYLPQFHPIPENDLWWGTGFTEWTNVVKARPLFEGHYQPHLPADLGFYDLRLAEVRAAQARMARQYGIYGFCYYHYWFNGRRVLERPLDEVLSCGEPDLPFCVCWANENWTRRWDGQENEVLLKQNYSLQDDIDHIRSLIPTFKDPRYIRIDGKPLFLVYKASHLPDPSASIETWRREAKNAGLSGLYVCCVDSSAAEHGLSTPAGADAAVEFAPDWTCLPRRIAVGRRFRLLQRRLIWGTSKRNHICEYAELVEHMLNKPAVDYRRFRCVTPMWDNSARRKQGAFITRNSTPTLYEHWLEEVIKQELKSAGSNRMVFINAWNEWAEGNHLEPCARWGTAYLEATLRAARSSTKEK
jgi:lipopolysaccharide biosynthesis protein